MNLAAAAQSSIGRKLVNGITGFLLLGFVIGHLIGNFLLLAGPGEFNNYAHFLESLGHGKLLYVVELGLIAIFLSHAWSGYSVWANKWKARRTNYEMPADAGGQSKKSVSSTSMLWTGVLLLAFVVVHVLQFKFGVFDAGANRDVIVDGVAMRNLYGIVIDAFSSPLWTGLYLLVMSALGAHLWHGAWSAFQSTGLADGNYLPTINKLGHALAGILAAGFLFLPAWVYVNNAHYQSLDDEYQTKYQVSQNVGDTIKVSGLFKSAEKGA